MSLGGRIRSACKAFNAPQHDQWVVAELSIAWHIVYRARNRPAAEQWILDSAKGRPADRFVTAQPLSTVREWNQHLLEGTAFWRSVVKLHRMIDSAKTDAMIDRASVLTRLSHPADTLEVTAEEGPHHD